MATGLKFQFDSIASDKYLIVAWYKNTNITGEIGRQAYAGPHLNVLRTLTAEIGAAAYTFKFYQSSNGTTLETLLRTWDIDGTVSANKIAESFEYVVGRGLTGDPTANSNVLADARLADALKDELEVKRRGLGTLRTDEFELHSGGGIELQNGDVFGDGETFHITWYHKGDAATTTTTSTTSEDVVTFSSNLTFDASLHMGKTLALTGGADTVVLTFPLFNTIIDGKVKINTNASTATYLKIQFASGNSVSFYGASRNKILLGRGEFIELTFKSTSCYVTSSVKDTGYERVGETEFSNYSSKPNTVLCDGSGAVHQISSFERLFDLLPTEMKVTFSEWNQSVNVIIGDVTKEYFYNRGKFAVDVATQTFKFPDLRSQSFRSLAYFDGTNSPERLSQGAGGMQPQQLIAHTHPIKVTDGDQGNTLTIADGGNSAYPITESDTIMLSVGGSEQRVDNVGKYAIVWI